MTVDRLLAVATVARRLSVTAETVRNWMRHDRIAFVRTPTGGYRIRQSVLTALLEGKVRKTQNP